MSGDLSPRDARLVAEVRRECGELLGPACMAQFAKRLQEAPDEAHRREFLLGAARGLRLAIETSKQQAEGFPLLAVRAMQDALEQGIDCIGRDLLVSNPDAGAILVRENADQSLDAAASGTDVTPPTTMRLPPIVAQGIDAMKRLYEAADALPDAPPSPKRDEDEERRP